MNVAAFSLVLAALAVPAFAAVEDEPLLETRFNLLVGFPGEGGAAVRLIPGTVIPSDGVPEVASALERSRLLNRLSDQLRETMHLGRVEVRYELNLTQRVGSEPVMLPSPGPASSFLPRVQLLAADRDRATYQIEFLADGKSVRKMPVTVEAGQRSIVGMLDGPDAPYVFLVVEPRGLLPDDASAPEDMTPPRVLSRVAPRYPEGALGRAAEVLLETTIGVDGRVGDVKVLSGEAAFHAVAVEAVRQWIFSPATFKGQPVPVQYIVTIQFSPGPP